MNITVVFNPNVNNSNFMPPARSPQSGVKCKINSGAVGPVTRFWVLKNSRNGSSESVSVKTAMAGIKKQEFWCGHGAEVLMENAYIRQSTLWTRSRSNPKQRPLNVRDRFTVANCYVIIDSSSAVESVYLPMKHKTKLEC
jgi:hypothetical protein